MAEVNFENLMIKSGHQFAKDLYKVFSSDAEKIFFSPLSIQISLIAAYFGADGETASEIKRCAHLPGSREELMNNIAQMTIELQSPKLNIANGIFIKDTIEILPEYKNTVSKFMNSECRNVNFDVDSRAQTVAFINEWVSSQTNNKIESIINEDSINNTVLLLLNALYFKDDWKVAFSKYDTYKQNFYTTVTNTRKVDMMHQTSRFRYSEYDQFKVLVLPYADENFKMAVLLPNEIEGLSEIEKSMNDLDFCEIVEKTTPVKVKVTYPKFKVVQSVNLVAALKSLGMNLMFEREHADFNKMKKPTGEIKDNLWYFKHIYVSDVLHKTSVDVTEEGTLSKIITETYTTHRTSAFGLGCARPREVDAEKLYEFKADHPFIFLIYHGKRIVFMGKFS